jgi:hypothetical protein
MKFSMLMVPPTEWLPSMNAQSGIPTILPNKVLGCL